KISLTRRVVRARPRSEARAKRSFRRARAPQLPAYGLLSIDWIAGGATFVLPGDVAIREERVMPTNDTGEKLALGSAIAGGALATALLEVLFDKGMLTLEESRTVLERALRNVGVHQRSNGGREAADVITRLIQGRFATRRDTKKQSPPWSPHAL